MEFREDFLQLVWKYQYFDKKSLCTTNGQSLSIEKTGFHNHAEGPDFHESEITLDGVKLYGHVEIHKKASHWKQHTHDADTAYNSVILHVVWENDKPALRNDGTEMPTLELKGLIYLDVWRRYQKRLDFSKKLTCAYGLKTIPEIIKFSTLEKSLVERLQEKSDKVLQILEATNSDWEETAYRWLFSSFGFKVNTEAMLELASKVPYKVLKKHREQLPALEAMLFGQAGLLPEETSEPYPKHLKKEYEFYHKKYGWSLPLSRPQWQFSKVRPGNFPTIRIAQLAAILSKSPDLMEVIFEDPKGFSGFKSIFQIEPSDYWKFHYSFQSESKRIPSRGISNTVLQLLMINFVIPLWFAYGRYFDQPDWKERCFDLLQGISPESNHIIRIFKDEDWVAENSFDTQGMIGLYKNYCLPKRCLQCKIAQSLLKSD